MNNVGYISISGMWFGNMAFGRQLLADFLKIGHPNSTLVETDYFTAVTTIIMPPLRALDHANWTVRSALLPPPRRIPNRTAVLTSELVSVMQNIFNKSVALDWFMLGLVEPYGYQVARIAKDATAFVHRQNSANLAIVVKWLNSSLMAQADKFADDAFGSFRRFCSNSTTDPTAPMVYINYQDPRLINFSASYYDTNYRKLQRVKYAYDPLNIFHYPQSIVALK